MLFQHIILSGLIVISSTTKCNYLKGMPTLNKNSENREMSQDVCFQLKTTGSVKFKSSNFVEAPETFRHIGVFAGISC